MKVLVVDDDPAARASVHRALVRAGCRVSVAEDGEAALRTLASRPHAAVVLDVRAPGIEPATIVRLGDLSLNTSSHRAERRGRAIDLTRTESALLELLMRNPRAVMTRTLIHERIWGYDFGAGSNALGVYVGYLRRKLEAGGEPRLIHTVRGVGYVLREE